MNDQLFEVAFSGEISEGANLDEVKLRLGKMFNADDAKLAQLFSGKRVVIKKNIDKPTAAKYQAALNKAGAQCEVAPMGGAAPASSVEEAKPVADASAAPAAAPAVQIETSYDGEVAPPPQVDPLGITGDQIEDLAATLAPVGSELKEDHEEVAQPDFDLSGLDVAPVGSDLATAPKKPDPPPPDTTGITMADE